MQYSAVHQSDELNRFAFQRTGQLQCLLQENNGMYLAAGAVLEVMLGIDNDSLM